MPLGQLTHLPHRLALNPFWPLMVRFARLKGGSFETLFSMEKYLLRYSWLGLLLLFALVLPKFEEIDYLSTLVRLATLVYPCLFIWSLTRLAGVELMQLLLEARWTGEVLASPLNNRELSDGFAMPVWLIARQYFLISLFSLALYTLETNVIVYDVEDEVLLLGETIEYGLFYWGVFFSSIAWIIFLYIGRLWIEVRLRSGLLKGLSTLFLLLCGITLLAAYLSLVIRWPGQMTDPVVLVGLGSLTIGLTAAALGLHLLLRRNFRRYLQGQLDLDPLIYDQVDPRATAWWINDQLPHDMVAKISSDMNAPEAGR